MAGAVPLDIEYVYMCEAKNDYRKVRVTFQIGEDGGHVSLYPEHAMELKEIHGVLIDFEEDILAKMRLKLAGECKVEYFFDGKKYAVDLIVSHKVKGLRPL